MPSIIEHDKYGRVLTSNPTKEVMTYEHGLTGTCWWCEQPKNKSSDARMKLLEKKIDFLKELIKLVITQGIPGGRSGYTGTGEEPMSTKRIEVGNDADKPTNTSQLVFWYSQDIDKIFQWRDSSWIDVSYSRPDATAEKRITDIVAEPGTDEVVITHTD